MPLSYGGLPSKLVNEFLMALCKKSTAFDEVTNSKAFRIIWFFEDEKEIKKLVELVFKYVREVSWRGRRILEGFLDNIRKSYANKHDQCLRRRRKREEIRLNIFPNIYREQLHLELYQILSLKASPRKLGRNLCKLL